MTPEQTTLLATAAAIGFVHTLLGPDHYLPFVAMAQARAWSRARTITVTVLCGVGHVLGSVALGLIGVAVGLAVGSLELVEAVRGQLAAWALIAFGLVYTVWGLRRAARRAAHRHGIRGHNHGDNQSKTSITPWVLFTVFVLGPCEPLIPILMYPAAQQSIAGMVLVTAVFALVTIATMVTIVLVLSFGFEALPVRRFEPYTHAFAGGMILLCGIAIQFGL